MNKGAEVNKGVFIAAIAAIVVVVCVAGYFFLNPTVKPMSPDQEKKYEEHAKSGPTIPGQPYPGMTGAGGSGGPSSGGPSSN
jgi:hypothetical protein